MKTARDSFLSFTTFVLLYVLVGTFLSIAFSLIDYAFPPVAGSFFRPSVSFGLATLVVVTPLLLGILAYVERISKTEPERLHNRVRRIFTYVTLFFSGAIIVGDFITTLYYFFDGQDFTTGFILKSLVLLAVALAVFWYYLAELGDRLTRKHRMVAAGLIVAFVLVEVGISFAVIGTPATNRALRYDDARVNDLQVIQNQVISYWTAKGALPETLSNVEAALLGSALPRDPESGAEYEYSVGATPTTFSLCATFSRASDGMSNLYAYPMGVVSNTWDHPVGRSCFARTIDPDYYPPTKPIIGN